MRLIDADKLKDWIDKYYDSPKYNKEDIKSIVDEQTTAYDADMVVEILDKEAHMLYSLQAFEPVKAWRNEYLIPVVKAGGTMTLMDILKGAVKE